MKKLETNAGRDSIINIKIKVFTKTEMTEYFSICEGESVIFNNQTYSDSGTYYHSVTNGDLIELYTIIVEKHNNPSITALEIINDNNCQITHNNEDKNAPYIFMLDGVDMNSSYIENIPIGNHIISVINKYGCKDPKDIFIKVSITPAIFFTPDANGINERWTIENIEFYPNCTVDIYNRFGKKLYHSNGYDNKNGWNGTYNGYAQSSTDYWYVISIEEIDKVFVGHFTLFRD